MGSLYLLLSPREAGFSAFKPVFMSESPPGREHFAAAFSHALSLSFFSCQLAVAKPHARGSSRLGRREKAAEDDGSCWKPYSPAPSVCFLPSTRALKRCPRTARSLLASAVTRAKNPARTAAAQTPARQAWLQVPPTFPGMHFDFDISSRDRKSL